MEDLTKNAEEFETNSETNTVPEVEQEVSIQTSTEDVSTETSMQVEEEIIPVSQDTEETPATDDGVQVETTEPVASEVEENKDVVVETIAVSQDIEEAPVENDSVQVETQTTAVEETPVAEETIPVSQDNEDVSDLDKNVQKELMALESEHLTESEEESDEESEEEKSEEEVTENYMTYSREQLVNALEECLKQEISSVRNKISLIKVAFYSKTNELKKEAFEKFLEEGGNKIDYHPEADNLEVAFKKSLDAYRERRKKLMEEQEALLKSNLKKKLEILDELKALINSEEMLKKTYDEFHNLQDRWKEIGQVPREEVNTLWQNYHFLIEKFFDKVKINKELKMLDLKKNLESKVELCEKAEELLVETSINKLFKTLQELRERWREVGPVPSDKNEEIWERFKTATDQIETRRREHYEQIRDEQEKNLLAKTALIEKAEEILAKEYTSIKEWNDTTIEMNDLLKLWKTIGGVPKAQNNEVWERFKSSLDAFFTSKNEQFQKLKDEQTNNYNLKVELCVQAEAIAKRDDWKRATEELLKLQKEWKEIGVVPRKLSDKIWLRFRSACDEFFKRKSDFFSNIREIEAENLAKKEALIVKVKEFSFSEDKNENLNTIKEFQREWMEIGYVPIKEKERLQTEFRASINKLFDDLKISQKEAKEHSFRTRVNNVRPEDAERFASRERRDILDKIQKMKEDIHLWDNNLGFLANSKQADILKKEFEKKIQHARQEIALLEAQLRILSETKNSSES